MADLTAESIRTGTAVASIADRNRASAQKAWDDNVKRAKAYVKVVMENNPGATELVFNRPDVQYILQQAALNAFEAVSPKIDQAAVAGSLAGSRVDGQRNGKYTPNGILTSLHGDLERIAKEFPDGVADVIRKHGELSSLDLAFRRYSLRVQMVAEAAVKMHYSLAMIEAMRGTGTKKMWKTTSLTPCEHCLALNGQIREWDDLFEVENFPIYGGELFGPQLHPNCRCILVIVSP